jgi:hypothetical protein
MTWKTINSCEIFMLFCYKLFKMLLRISFNVVLSYVLNTLKKEKKMYWHRFLLHISTKEIKC